MKKKKIQTTSRTAWVNIDALLRDYIEEEQLTNALLTVYCPHTTAGLTVNENADPDVESDWFAQMALISPDRSFFRHAEGNSDAHVKSSLVGISQNLIVENAHIQLGRWQSVYFTEFDGPRQREIWISHIVTDCDTEKNE